MLTKAFGEVAPPTAFVAACSEIKRQLKQPGTWALQDYSHLALRLLSCTPYLAHDVQSLEAASEAPQRRALRTSTAAHRAERRAPVVDMPLSLAVGQLLDSVCMQRSYLRKWANLWCQWSFKYIMALAGHHNCSHGVDRDDVPCHVHGNRRTRDVALELHAVTNLTHDAAAVGSGSDMDSDSDSCDSSNASSDSSSDSSSTTCSDHS